MNFNMFVFPYPTASYSAYTYKNLIWVKREATSKKSIIKVKSTTKGIIKGVLKPNNNIENLKFSEKSSTTNNTNNLNKPQRNVPKNSKGNTGTPSNHIPCIFIPAKVYTKHILMYFHANAEDIGTSYELLEFIGEELKINVLLVEYPGYGIYEGKPTSKQILEDSLIVFDFLVHQVGFQQKNIFVFGRSIGTGPSTYLSAHRKPGMLILMSPFLSIKRTVKDFIGSFAKGFIAKHFDNMENLKKVKAPVLLIHGQKDTLIPSKHSLELFKAFDGTISLVLCENMSHNEFDCLENVINPIRKFIKKQQIKTYREGKRMFKIKFPEGSKKLPELCKYSAKVGAIRKLFMSQE